MAELTYFQKLQDPRWQKLRLQAMQAKDFTCEICGTKEITLHVHHKEYLKGHEPWEYHANQLSVVCKDCHEEQHDNFDFFKWTNAFLNLSDRHYALFLMAGFGEIPYEGIISFTCFIDKPIYKKLYELGKKARKIKNEVV